MQTKRNDVLEVGDKPSSNSVTLANSTGANSTGANSTGDVVVLDENSLEDASGGMILPPVRPPIFPLIWPLPFWPPVPKPGWPPIILAGSS